MQLTSVIPQALDATFMLFASKNYLNIHVYRHNNFRLHQLSAYQLASLTLYLFMQIALYNELEISTLRIRWTH